MFWAIINSVFKTTRPVLSLLYDLSGSRAMRRLLFRVKLYRSNKNSMVIFGLTMYATRSYLCTTFIQKSACEGIRGDVIYGWNSLQWSSINIQNTYSSCWFQLSNICFAFALFRKNDRRNWTLSSSVIRKVGLFGFVDVIQAGRKLSAQFFRCKTQVTEMNVRIHMRLIVLHLPLANDIELCSDELI